MDKTMGGVYEPSQSFYRSYWSRVKKKLANALRLAHDRQPLNKVNIRNAGVSPKLNELVEPSAGAQCYSIFDWFCNDDACSIAQDAQDARTIFSSSLEPLELASTPMGYTNTSAKFQTEHGVYFEARDSG